MPLTHKERDRRFQAVRDNMKKEGLDALVVYGSTGTGIPFNGNYPYLANHTPIYSSALLFFPPDGDPTAFIPGENQLLDARRTTWIEDARLSRQPAADLCAHMKSALKTPSRIGVSSLASIPSNALRHLQSEFANVEFCDAGATVFSPRESKSDEELAAARRGADVADLGFRRSLEIIRPGLSELEWRAEIERVMTAEGADGGFNMLGVGRPDGDGDVFRGFVMPPTARKFREGDLALLEISPRVEGYFSQMVRLVSLGEPPEPIRMAQGACVKAKAKALAQLNPGASFVDVGKAIDDSLKDAGYRMKAVGSAHTIGLDLSESIINLMNPGEVKERMLVTMHPMLEIAEWRQLFVGETYLVTDGRPESLSGFDDEIFVLN